MSFFRDNSRLSDRIKGKTTDEIINEIRSDFDKDRGSFFDRPSTNRTGIRSRFGPSVDQFFPRTSFDDDLPRRGSPHRADLRSHLDDLARRHPDIADQLRGFPTSGEPNYTSGSADRTATEAGAPEQRQDQDSSSQTQGSQDGAGFREDSKIGNLQNHGLRNTVPLVDPSRSSTTSHQSAAHPHSTMNSQQDAQGSRSPRAQSAPPTSADESSGGQPRFVSKIEIQPNGTQTASGGPAAPQETGGDSYAAESAPPQSQSENHAPPPPPQHHGQPHNNYTNQQQQDTSKAHVKQPNVRHIPIFVEGRDAPIVNRDHEPPSSFHHQEAPPAHHPRYREPIFEPVFSAANNVPVDRPFGGAHHTPGGVGFDIPIQTERGGFRPNQFGGSGFSKPQQPQRPAPSEKVHRVFTQQTEAPHAHPARAQQAPHAHPPHHADVPDSAHPTPASAPAAAPSPPPKKMSRPKTPLEVIQEVQAEVDKLKAEIDKYTGTSRKEKEYIYLDEMLTRELLKLDNVETGGVEEIRNLRKQTIKNIQATIAALEAKVPSTPAGGAVSEEVPSPAGGENQSVAGGESGVGEGQGAGDANTASMEVDATKPEGGESQGESGEAKAESGEGKGEGDSSAVAPAQPGPGEKK